MLFAILSFLLIFATEIGKVSQIPRRIAVPKGRVWEAFSFFIKTLEDELFN
jgi:hypothetical protein